jgi:DNA-directed RNA polymerase specialized sigma24 family protein
MLNNKESDIFYKKYFPVIRKYYTSKKINYSQSKELTHDCLTNILIKIDSTENFNNEYIIKIAKNFLIDNSNQKYNKIKKMDISEYDFSEKESNEDDYSQHKNFLKEKFNSDDFLIIDYYFFQNYKPSELGVLLNTDVKKIKNKIDYLRKKIKEIIQK